MKTKTQLALLTFLLPTLGYAGDELQSVGSEKAVAVEALSRDLRDLLSQEMQALQSGMVSIVPAYVSGNWGEIETTARTMKNSYLLKRNLTKSQAEELHSVLPPSFVEKDQRFHYLAGMLEQVAGQRKVELIGFYFSEMMESCAGCHTAFATHRFPSLSPKEEIDGHSHH